MANGVMAYSGLVTKTRAMRKELFTGETLRQLTELDTVNEAVSFLKTSGSYGPVYQHQEGDWHRSQVEALMYQALWRDYEKLYRFSNAGQRQALELVFLRYETNWLKRCMKEFYQSDEIETPEPGDFFIRHASIPVEQIKAAANREEFVRCLAGTPYAGVFVQQDESYAQYAFGLDVFYYTRVYKWITRQKRSKQRNILQQVYGTQIDWLNLMWVYRSKRYLTRSAADTYALLIPVYYRVKKQELTALAEAESLPEMNRILANTAYFKGREAYLKMEDEISYRQVIEKTYNRLVKKYPMSMAPVLQYLYQKELEQERIISVLEGIRYKVAPKDIRDYVLLTAE